MPNPEDLQNFDDLNQEERIKLTIQSLKHYTTVLKKLTAQQRQLVLTALKRKKTQQSQEQISELEKQIQNLED